ncbi:hypothetical protein M3231_03130 [Neobacillus mesonae]|nr:hypothetical protein [Neobacillus mesonae]
MWNRIIKILLTFLFLFTTCFMVAPLTVKACSCAEPPSIEDQMKGKTAIFTGKLLSLTKPVEAKIMSSADPVKALFEVKTVWKGELNSQTTVYTAMNSASCGYEGFEVNEEFIVFAYGKLDRLETGLCEGTKNLESAQEELKNLGTGYKPLKTSPQENRLEIHSVNNELNNRFIIF